MSDNFFIFKSEGAFKTCSLAFIFFSLSLFLIPLSSAVEIRTNPNEGVIINPFVKPYLSGNFSNYNNYSYYNITIYTNISNITYNNYTNVSYSYLNGTSYNDTYNTWLPNYTLFNPFWYNYTLFSPWNQTQDGIFQNNLSKHVGIGVNNPGDSDLYIKSDDRDNTYISISTGQANGNATITFREANVVRWQERFNSVLNKISFWNSNYGRDFLSMTQLDDIGVGTIGIATNLTVGNNIWANGSIWASNLCYANGSNCNTTASSVYNVTYHSYNTSTGLSAYYVPYTGAITDVNIGNYNFTTNRSISFGTEGIGIKNLMYMSHDNNLSTISDGFRIDYNYNFEALNDDWLVFVKTDGNDAMPDGGIAFVMENNSKHNLTVLKLDGAGLANFSRNIWAGGNVTADWFFGKINFSDVQNNPWAYNMTIAQGTFNSSYHAVTLSTAVFNSTYNATYNTWLGNYSEYSPFWYNMTIAQGTFNSSYHAVILSTAVFNRTYNASYEAMILSTAVYNSTYNSSYLVNTGDTMNGNLVINGNLTIIGSYIEANVTTQNMNGSIIPAIDNTFNIGSLVKRWANGFFNNMNVTGNLYVNNILANSFLYNMSDGSYNISYHAMSLSTAVYNSTYNSSYAAGIPYFYNMSDGSYNISYHNLIPLSYSTDVFNSTYNSSYNALILSTALFNSTYNSSYQSLILSTNVFNSTYNATYHDISRINFNETYINFDGDNMTGPLNMTGANIYSNANITIAINEGYFAGQPLAGMLGSGIINTNITNTFASINVTCSGLTCNYPAFEVRLTDGSANLNALYCKIPAGSKVVTNNQHSVVYIDENCNIQSSEIGNYFDVVLPSLNYRWDAFNVVSYNGQVESIDAISLEQRRMLKQRIINYNQNHLQVTSGLARQIDGFPVFNITAGKYIYLMDVVPVNKKDTSIDKLELVGHNGTSTSWFTLDQNGLNVTHCDNGTTVIPCSGGAGLYRRHFVFIVGYDEEPNEAELHQLYPSDSMTYSTIAQCLDTTTYPLTYTLPDWYLHSAVPLYAYCSLKGAASWSVSNWIDLRTVKTGSATATVTETDPIWTAEKGSYVPYTGATGNVTLGEFNITANWFKGKFNWTTLTNWLSFDGAILSFNETKLNNTIANEGNRIGFNSTFNSSYHAVTLSTAVYNSTYNASYNALILSTNVFNSTYNASYNSLILSTNVYNSTYNASYNALILSTNVFNSTYNTTYHNAINNYSSYNSTYATWLPNYTVYSPYWYNMSDGSYNGSYVKKTGDVMTGALNMSNIISFIGNYYLRWVGSDESTVEAYIYEQNGNVDHYLAHAGGNFTFNRNLVVAENVTADWFFGKINLSDVQNNPWAYNMTEAGRIWNESAGAIFPNNLSQLIGIGTATPSAQIEINTVNPEIRMNDTDWTTVPGGKFGMSGANYYWSVIAYNDDWSVRQNPINVKHGGGVGIYDTGPDASLEVAGTFRVSSSIATEGDVIDTSSEIGTIKFDTDTLFINGTSNNVGIKTSTPNANASLDVYGAISVKGGNRTHPGIFWNGDTDTGIYSDAANNVMITTNGNPTVYFRDTDIILTSADLNMNGGKLYGDNDANQNLILAATSHPTNTSSQIRANVAYANMILNATGTVFNEDSNDLDFRVESNGNENMLFVDGGNDRVGIGIATPAYPLHINNTVGQIRVEDDSGRYIDVSSQGSNIRFVSPSSTSLAIESSHNMTLEPGLSPTVYLIADGKVGIGTATPAYRLQVVGAVTGSDYIEMLDGSDSNNLRARLGYVDGSGGLLNLYKEDETSGALIRSYGDSYFKGGDVYIGSVAADAGVLTVSNPTGNDKPALWLNNTYSQIIMTDSGSGAMWNMHTWSDNDLAFHYNYSGAGEIRGLLTLQGEKGGEVGIGTLTPTARFNVEGGNVTFNDGSGAYSFRVEGDTAGNLLFVDGKNDRVGIATASPSDTLTVTGTTSVQTLRFYGSQFSNSRVSIPTIATNAEAIVMRFAGANTVDLMRWENSSGSRLGAIDNQGNLNMTASSYLRGNVFTYKNITALFGIYNLTGLDGLDDYLGDPEGDAPPSIILTGGQGGDNPAPGVGGGKGGDILIRGGEQGYDAAASGGYGGTVNITGGLGEANSGGYGAIYLNPYGGQVFYGANPLENIYIPYTGATKNVSLGNNNISAGNYYSFAGGGYIKDNGTALILGHA